MLRSSALIHCFSIVFHIKYEKIPQRRGKLPGVFNQPMRHVFPLHDGQKMNGLFVLRTGFLRLLHASDIKMGGLLLHETSRLATRLLSGGIYQTR